MTGQFVERRLLPPVGLALLPAFPLLADPAELPPEIQADRYLLQAERQIQLGEHAEAMATLDKPLAMQIVNHDNLPQNDQFDAPC